jgi:glycosyltransferase involved in cell wall biosynthesis
MRLVIVTPVRDEAQTLDPFIRSVLKQDVMPERWLLVDDNSTDNSLEIIRRWASEYPIIEVIEYCRATERATGGHVVEVVNFGLEHLRKAKVDWDVFLKLDADVEIERNDYLSEILVRFADNPRLGIASGTSYVVEDGRERVESSYVWQTYGTNKFYRHDCFIEMGGLRAFKGWDGIDDIFARHHGFLTRKFPDLRVRHFYVTQTRSAEGGIWAGLRREALGYRNRSYPLFMYLLKGLRIAVRPPVILAGAYFIFYGLYLNATVKPVLSKKEKKIVRNFLWDRFLGRLEK